MVLQFIGTQALGLMLVRDALVRKEIRIRNDRGRQLNSEVLITMADHRRR